MGNEREEVGNEKEEGWGMRRKRGGEWAGRGVGNGREEGRE